MIEYENLGKLNGLFAKEFRARLDEVLASGWFILGAQVRDFEKEFARYCVVPHCIGVANGLDALTLALRSYGFKPGSEVIVPSNTYIATILAVLNCNLVPVLVEPDEATCNIDPSRMEEAITPRTVAIMVVHLYGKCCDMESIMAIASRRGMPVIEDCAQAHGASQKGMKAGTFGAFGAFSFYPTKNLGALGDGGCLTTSDETLMIKIQRLRNYGSDKKYYNEVIGVNSRLDELQAAFLRIKLGALDRINEHKRKLAVIYSKELKSDYIKPSVDPEYQDVHHIYHVRHPKRDELKAFLLKHDIQTEVHYPVAPHRQNAMRGILDGKSFPISEAIHATTLSLPVSFIHNEDDIRKVVEVMNRF